MVGGLQTSHTINVFRVLTLAKHHHHHHHQSLNREGPWGTPDDVVIWLCCVIPKKKRSSIIDAVRVVAKVSTLDLLCHP